MHAQICTLHDISAASDVASAHSLMALRALAAQNYCVLSGFLFFDQTGMDFTVDFWTGVFLPSQTPPKIVQAYAREINRITAMLELQARLTGLGYLMMPASPEEFAAIVKRDVERYRKIIIESKMQLLE